MKSTRKEGKGVATDIKGKGIAIYNDNDDDDDWGDDGLLYDGNSDKVYLFDDYESVFWCLRRHMDLIFVSWTILI